MNDPTASPIVLFDGVCNVCSSAVQFIIRRDPAGRFRFASLQSEAGRELLLRHGLPADRIDTIVLIENGRSYTRSTAILRVVRGLKGAWPLLYGGIIIPRPLRDGLYRWFAANRYRWFGQRESCMLPTPDIRRRFLE
ncbi:thiol-disulfide oxidoreductase DCC family protein [Paenibacillus athensensis]|uniref:Thiol-disulfide oxidoreductase DCC family protein n=1 Tax=Paenibacillus athensensis TaxID=1967502 RepID=A0A4Y8PT32_9BACL|nr:thiol-disulfide oxidoreductase DCC family protein [Paenibacillus athensensis]MCD1261321.1 thiol-disulfide oxidoreductase DCC family protein [Paenibacillus athensensis]